MSRGLVVSGRALPCGDDDYPARRSVVGLGGRSEVRLPSSVPSFLETAPLCVCNRGSLVLGVWTGGSCSVRVATKEDVGGSFRGKTVMGATGPVTP